MQAAAYSVAMQIDPKVQVQHHRDLAKQDNRRIVIHVKSFSTHASYQQHGSNRPEKDL
jgi:hypothetical protein